MAKGRIVIISGPSGSGKTTLHKMLLESPLLRGKLVKSISATTRPNRPGEKNGRDYLFISVKMFLYKINAGQFLEWQKVFDNYYGTPKKAAKELLSTGKHVLLCIAFFPMFPETFFGVPLTKKSTERETDQKRNHHPMPANF
jgi:guanylate kinase